MSNQEEKLDWNEIDERTEQALRRGQVQAKQQSPEPPFVILASPATWRNKLAEIAGKRHGNREE